MLGEGGGGGGGAAGMMRVCEACVARCHKGHKGIRFIKESNVLCMCYAVTKVVGCACNARVLR